MPSFVGDSHQTTLKSDVTVSGHALFAGTAVTATMRPAPADSGIRFRRIDLPGRPEVSALIDCVIDRPRRTALRLGDASVEMVEHCLSAFAGLQIDNALIEVSGPEPPVGDGSAAIFVEALERAGTVTLPAPRRPLVLSAPITIRDGETMIAAFPATGSVSDYLYILDYGADSPLGRQVHSVRLTPDAYREQIARARTYSTHAEAKAMWDRGLFKHLTPRDMLVIGDQGPIENVYRYENEPVRHKLLDMIGDLSLVGRPIVGRFIAVRSGHSLNHRLAREMAARWRPSGSSPASEPPMDLHSLIGYLKQRFPTPFVERVNALLA
ncbi:MAG: UDP-3-O-[3-hydroxymyristoyl] N-acetylglucosamine deacetylase [Phycisphaerae bacterium]|nr:UDP-3-O-[3-hydroxymyristoyl] N-acetylglucosamine deacetylase [Phycisphaerae bacterium]